jgi:hypothetical protein
MTRHAFRVQFGRALRRTFAAALLLSFAAAQTAMAACVLDTTNAHAASLHAAASRDTGSPVDGPASGGHGAHTSDAGHIGVHVQDTQGDDAPSRADEPDHREHSDAGCSSATACGAAAPVTPRADVAFLDPVDATRLDHPSDACTSVPRLAETPPPRSIS